MRVPSFSRAARLDIVPGKALVTRLTGGEAERDLGGDLETLSGGVGGAWTGQGGIEGADFRGSESLVWVSYGGGVARATFQGSEEGSSEMGEPYSEPTGALTVADSFGRWPDWAFGRGWEKNPWASRCAMG